MNGELEILKILRNTSALMEGHFRLSSGKHSNRYLQCAKVLQYPEHARSIGRELAGLFSGTTADAVIAPAIGGILVAHELAAALGCRAIFGEREDGLMTLRRGFHIDPEERLIIVEDVITTGKSTREIVQLVEAHQGIVAGIGAIADRSRNTLNLPLLPKALVKLDFENWDESECKLCQARIPIYSPGSRFTK